MTLLAIGLGYCAQRFVAASGRIGATFGTARERARVEQLEAEGFNAGVCDGPDCDQEVRDAAGACDILLVSAPPDQSGDPVLGAFAAELRRPRSNLRVVYLSTIGVYGDHAGAWIDERAQLRPVNVRSERRIAAEEEWLRFGRETGARVFVLRLGGIYGPGRNPLAAVAAGSARRIVKPGQVFNRIHVDDVARAIDACLSTEEVGGVFNVVDDEPAPQGDPILFAAQLLGAPPPPEIPFGQVDMSAMGRSFWAECKRASNRHLKEVLGVTLAYPTFREGLRALYAAGEAQERAQ